MKLFILASLFCFSILASHAQDLNIATVNISNLYRNYYKTKEMMARTATREKAISEDESLIAIKEMDQTIRQKRKLMGTTPDSQERERLSTEIEQDEKTLKIIRSETEKLIQRRKKASKRALVLDMESLLLEISNISREYAEAKNYDILFDISGVSSTQLPVLVYIKTPNDITAELKAVINAAAPPQKTTEDTQPSNAN